MPSLSSNSLLNILHLILLAHHLFSPLQREGFGGCFVCLFSTEPFFFMFFSIMVCYTILNRVPCWGSRALLFSHSTCKSWHSLTPDSQPVPPPFSLALGNHQSVLYVNLFLLYRHVHLCHILHSTYKWYHMVFVWFASNVIISGSIHIAADDIVWFLLVANIPSRIFFEKDLWNSPWTMSHSHCSLSSLTWPPGPGWPPGFQLASLGRALALTLTLWSHLSPLNFS